MYDISIDGPPEFFANGVLVHNCVDLARYLLSSERTLSVGYTSRRIEAHAYRAFRADSAREFAY